VRFKKYRFDFGTKGKTEEAKKAVSDARHKSEDTSLILTEANLYLETKDFDIQKISGTSFGKKKMNDDLVLT
jgi:hypothetical protein